ncbi:UDP-galactose 4-epimerase [Melghirimyces profundicolus]|uniref:UDP-glucose 4-epimerase n=1 Tax=Melghirimyces profundicolus TaxID=1242148 RepID=A0A2T6C7Z0_9BACL|nr:UDP-glucose 4-epimerase GalE [Melghirimyces profundicolus]PTX64441.1 UDP-galactose 4-epimerase [Melghirimyces profundicolus]
MAVLVTGGAGYIGSHTVVHLKERGEEVVVLDGLKTGHVGAVQGDAFYEGDLRDGEVLERIFSGHDIDAVVHFAASSLVGESAENPLKYYDNNVYGTLCLLRKMAEHGVEKIVFSSTAAVYGEPKNIPIRETDPTRPTNPYGETKLAVEKMLAWCEKASGVRSVSLRYFNAAGALPGGQMGEDHDPETHLIPIVLQTALGQRESIAIFGEDYPTKDGTCIRDYIHVMDLAEAHGLALEKLRRGGGSGVYNLGNGEGFSVKEVIRVAREVTGREIPVKAAPRRSVDPAVLVASSEKARSELGWQPKYPRLEEIIESAWNWHQSHPHGYESRHGERGSAG